MEIRIITKANKFLNAIAVASFLFGTFSTIWTASISSELWAGITLGILGLGFLMLLINWLLVNSNTINISADNILHLTINSDIKLEDLKENKEIQYHGNYIELINNRKFEIQRIHVLELAKKLDPIKIKAIKTPQKFYNISPRELLEIIISLGP